MSAPGAREAIDEAPSDDDLPLGTVVNPSLDDPLVSALCDVVGGPVGHYAAAPRLRYWQSRVLAGCTGLAGLSMLAALLLRNHCRATLWKTPDQFTHLCYSDITAVYSAGGLAAGIRPYLDHPDGSGFLAQPVGTGALFALLQWLTPGGAAELRWVFDTAALLLLLCLIATTVAVGVLAGRRAWDAALVAASPLVAVSALVSLDLAAVALGTVGLAAFGRRRPVLGGVLVGLGVAVRPVEVVLVAAVVIVAWSRRRLAATVPFCVAAALGWAVLNLPILMIAHEGWLAYWSAWWKADLSYGSLWLLPQVLSTDIDGQQLPTPPLWVGSLGVFAVLGYLVVYSLAPLATRDRLRPRHPGVAALVMTVIVVLPFAAVALGAPLLPRLAKPLPAITGHWIAIVGYPLVLLGVAWIVRRCPEPPRIAPVALMLLVGWLLVSPAIPVQAGIWLLPLVAMTTPSWRLMLTFATVESTYSCLTWLYLYGLSVANRGAPGWIYLVAVLVRVFMLCVLGWRAWSLSAWPEDDVIRLDVGDDPAAGALLTPAPPPTTAPMGRDVVGEGPASR